MLSIYGLDKNEKFTPKAQTCMKSILSLLSMSSASGVIPSDKQVNATDMKKSSLDLETFISKENPLTLGGKEFTSLDFVDETNKKAFTLALARRQKELFNLNKGKGNRALSESQAASQAFDELSSFLEKDSWKWPGTDTDILGTSDIKFDTSAFDRFLLDATLKDAAEQLNDSVGIDELP